jgi:hypothetical protein
MIPIAREGWGVGRQPSRTTPVTNEGSDLELLFKSCPGPIQSLKRGRFHDLARADPRAASESAGPLSGAVTVASPLQPGLHWYTLHRTRALSMWKWTLSPAQGTVSCMLHDKLSSGKGTRKLNRIRYYESIHPTRRCRSRWSRSPADFVAPHSRPRRRAGVIRGSFRSSPLSQSSETNTA